MKQRLLNRCQNCGHAWFPRGFDLSRKCPNCGSVDVDFTGRIYLGILAVIAIAAGIFWASDRPHKTAKNIATPPPVTPWSYMRPRPNGAATPAAPTEPSPRITTELEGRAAAVRLYPDLAVAYTPLNIEFVARYHRYRREKPAFFQDPAWPVLLVKECAAAIGERDGAP
ncbi:MAG: hypothetical protein ABJF10_03220 [Chthoniobacter sp.]|uniref:hypothetical protein n=1 Tax=Chthoniobacter sp. TaxID=2510640 RepID=UPI0032AABB81